MCHCQFNVVKLSHLLEAAVINGVLKVFIKQRNGVLKAERHSKFDFKIKNSVLKNLNNSSFSLKGTACHYSKHRATLHWIQVSSRRPDSGIKSPISDFYSPSYSYYSLAGFRVVFSKRTWNRKVGTHVPLASYYGSLLALHWVPNSSCQNSLLFYLYHQRTIVALAVII